MNLNHVNSSVNMGAQANDGTLNISYSECASNVNGNQSLNASSLHLNLSNNSASANSNGAGGAGAAGAVSASGGSGSTTNANAVQGSGKFVARSGKMDAHAFRVQNRTQPDAKKLLKTQANADVASGNNGNNGNKFYSTTSQGHPGQQHGFRKMADISAGGATANANNNPNASTGSVQFDENGNAISRTASASPISSVKSWGSAQEATLNTTGPDQELLKFIKPRLNSDKAPPPPPPPGVANSSAPGTGTGVPQPPTSRAGAATSSAPVANGKGVAAASCGVPVSAPVQSMFENF